jgi:ATP-dependent protease HslVU (ClpYQ) peptidase subunit
MTCIVGVAKKGKVYIGGDSCGSGHTWQQVGNPKVFLVDNRFLIGCTTSFRMIDLLRFELKVDDQPTDVSDDAFIRTTFVKAVRECFKEHGWLGKASEKNEGGNFLLGYKGTLYEVQDDFSVLNSPVEGMSVGSGESPARGSLYTTRGDKDPEARITKALEAAEAIAMGVKAPFIILSK